MLSKIIGNEWPSEWNDYTGFPDNNTISASVDQTVPVETETAVAVANLELVMNGDVQSLELVPIGKYFLKGLLKERKYLTIDRG